MKIYTKIINLKEQDEIDEVAYVTTKFSMTKSVNWQERYNQLLEDNIKKFTNEEFNKIKEKKCNRRFGTN